MLKYITLKDPGVPEFVALVLAVVGLLLIGQVSLMASWGAVALWFALVIIVRSQIENATKVS